MKKIFLNGLVFGTAFCISIVLFYYLAKARSGTTSTPGDKLTSTKRNELNTKVSTLESSLSTLNTTVSSLSSSVPAGSIIAFNLASCPTGRSAFTQGVGRFFVGVGADGQGNTYSLLANGGEAKHTLTISEIPSHSHNTTIPPMFRSEIIGGGSYITPTPSIPYDTADDGSHVQTSTSVGGGLSHENRPPYVAVLYCIKN